MLRFVNETRISQELSGEITLFELIRNSVGEYFGTTRKSGMRQGYSFKAKNWLLLQI